MIYADNYDSDIEKLKALGQNAPKTMEDLKVVYANRFSDERQTERAIKDNNEPVHWGFGHHAHIWLHDRALLKKHTGILLESLPLEDQWMDGICRARDAENEAIRAKYRHKDEEPQKTNEPQTEFDRWLLTIPPRYRKATIKDFGESTASMQTHIMQGGSLLMIGPTGTRKSSFLWAMAREIAENLGTENVKVMNLRAILSEARSYGDDWSDVLIRLFGSVPWLFIDEADKVDGSSSDLVMVSALIDHRYAYNLPTVCAGNGNIRTIERKLGEASVSRLIASKENGMLVNLDGNRDERNS